MKKSNRIAWALILFLAGCILGNDRARADSIVQITAEVQGLEPLAPAACPQFGTYWWAEPNATFTPAPCPPLDPTLPVYAITSDQFLIDGTAGVLPRAATVAAAMEVESNAVVNLINQVQGRQIARTMARAMGISDLSFDSQSTNGTDGAYSSGVSALVIDTNQLWLQITNLIADTVYASINNATDHVYAIWSTTNLALPFADWQVELEVFPTSNTTNCLPFTISMEDRLNLFLRAQDWTGVTENGNETPEWWFWLYYGVSGLSLSDTNLDSQDNDLYSDYINGVDPNVISFSLSVTNQYINGMSAPVQITINGGVPFFFATLVDNTNFAGAIWNPYTLSNITVNLGSVQGWHDVWVGLRGYPTNATQTWQWKHLNLALQPLLVITNPTTPLVDEPIIQIYGYSQDRLASISYGISNAVGVVVNEPSEITDQYFDTNAGNFTTNYFECLDVALTNGLNIVTIYATDLAGNTTVTNLNFTLDYSSKTNPPAFQINWPQNGTQISGGAFTCQGVLSDPTATVSAQVVFTNANTNLFYGGIYTNTYVASVERNGTFWLENLPLEAGTNFFAIQVTDAAGNTNFKNLSVVHSALNMTINPVTPDSQLWQPTVYLSGTISATNYAVWVNGVKGHNNGDGSWYANGVPVNSTGAANFTATAYDPSEVQPDGSCGN